MKLNIRNLGKIKKAEIELKDLTIICGPNSSNKTWLSYLIGNMLTTIYTPLSDFDTEDEIRKFSEDIIKNGESSIDVEEAKSIYFDYLQLIMQNSKETLPDYFKADKDSLSDLYFDIDTNSFSEHKGRSREWASGNVTFSFNNNKITARYTPKINEDEDVNFEKKLQSVITHSILYISGLISEYSFMKPHIVSSERTGALMFQVEMDRSSILIDELLRNVGGLDIEPSDKKRLIGDLFEKLYSTKSRLPTPVNMNVRDVRDIAKTKEIKSVVSHRHPEVIDLLNKINGGEFIYDNNEIKFVQSDGQKAFTISSTSSSIKSIFLIDLIIRHKLLPGEIILIDEPELNLHPDNQRLMARLIVRLINAGVKILITTHSDFLIREINNSIMLSNDFDDKEDIMQANDIIEQDILSPSRVSAYMVDQKGVVSNMEVGKLGINTQIFDSIINSANQLQSEIFFSLDGVDE
ncbi:AAA family ATPase [Vibrio parahaemolyticus]|nr:AAA family ATPase [Vibrio parahaemolyticus]